MCLAFFAAYISCRNHLLSSCSLHLYVLYILRFTGNSWGSAGKLWSWYFCEVSRETLPCWSWFFCEVSQKEFSDPCFSARFAGKLRFWSSVLCEVSRKTLPFWSLFFCEVSRKTFRFWSSFLCKVSRKTLRFWSSVLILLAVPGHCFLLLYGIFRGSASNFFPFCLVCWTSFLAREPSRHDDHFLVRFSQEGLPFWCTFPFEVQPGSGV